MLELIEIQTEKVISKDLSAEEHIIAAIKCNKDIKDLQSHLAALRGDAFNLSTKIRKLNERATWHMDYAEAINNGTSHFMWSL